MTNQRKLTFSQPNESYSSIDAVIFLGDDGKLLVPCSIIGEVLHFRFKRKERTESLDIFRSNRVEIENKARDKYLAGKTEADGSIVLFHADF